MKTKRCSTCKEAKPVSEFHKNRSKKDGLAEECKMCRNEYGRIYYEANREKVKTRARRYREANKEKVAEANRRWREAHTEREAERKRIYREVNRAQKYRRNVKECKERNARTLEIANRNGLPWEDWEDEFVMADNGLTYYQKAVKLERSWYSVRGRKDKLRKKAKNELTHDNVRV